MFVEIVGGRCEIDLLFETPLSLASIQEYPFEYIRSIHFGINDLSLALNEIHMFSVYFNIHFREACSFLASKRYSFGIGGIGSVNARPYSPTMIIASSLLLGSSCFILSRNFLNSVQSDTQKEYIDGLSYQYSLLVEEYNRVQSLNHEELLLLDQQFRSLFTSQ